jgi:predicted ArsR family transcriptional regulator
LSHETNQLITRQLEVLHLLSNGRTTAEIAEELGLSQTTVRNYIANLLVALGRAQSPPSRGGSAEGRADRPMSRTRGLIHLDLVTR